MPDRSPTAARLLLPLLGLDLAAVLLVVQVHGYALGSTAVELLLLVVLGAAVLLSIVRDVLELRAGLRLWPVMRRQLVDWLLLALCATLPSLGVHGTAVQVAVLLRQVVHALRLIGRTRYGAAAIDALSRKPAQLMLLTFALAIGLGALFLTFPLATRDGHGASFVDALFTATSATCVTGLAVQDTGLYFTRFGQIVILALIQVGGLGIMTLSGSAAILLGRRLGVRSRSLLAESMELGDVNALRQLMVTIVKATILIELGGALLLFLRFLPGRPAEAAAYLAVFHAVSAFCNAGFSTFSDSLMSYRGDLAVNAVIGALIVLGGLGFTVLRGLASREASGRRAALGLWARSSVHLKLVLPATALLLVVGAVGFYFLEHGSTLRGLPLGEKLLGAGFQSVTARTAGFNTVDIGLLGGPGVMLLVILMFIGGAPGSTAGGIKVTTASVLLLSVRAMLGGRHEVEIFDRTIPKEVVYKATAITVISFLLVVVVFSFLLWSESGRFEVLLFETVSAFGTVGLSMNYTPSLSVPGRLLIAGLMYAGRTGPLTIALAIGEESASAQVRLPSENVLVG
jgi:trk system potassium uptake protein TrkH